MDSYTKVGRGGAGNYYSQQEVKEAATRLKDLEAQPTQGNITSQADPEASRPSAHIGRGGAGNFVPTATASATGITSDLSTSLKEGSIGEIGYSGRGGAGNFRGDGERNKSDAQAQSSESKERAYEETVRDVEQSMRAPEKAHLGSEKIGEQ